MKFSTRLIHTGRTSDQITGAVTPPIYQTSTYAQEYPGSPRLFEGRALSYSRTENPTRTALENAVAALEGAPYGLAFSSGLGAVNTILNLLKSGDHVIAGRDLYGGSYRMFTKLFTKFGVSFSFIDTGNLKAIEETFRPSTRILWLESPSNPLLNITDIKAAAKVAHEQSALVVVDNTFATPILQQPISLGADVILHSTTKYINGHLDVIGGALVTASKDLWDELKFYQNAVGAIPGPQDCFLTLRGLVTLDLRVEKHCANAIKVAAFLTGHPDIKRIYFPGLLSHPGHNIAKEQMTGFGAMVSFDLESKDKAVAFLQKLRLFTLAESLGGIKSLVCHPPTMTHASVEPETRLKAGISDGLIRLSIGLEDADDLIEDLDRALFANGKT